ncbi:MAG: hypothetical protein MUO36_04710, partial [Candidatus Hadarchaeum sp.]|nr:hypothetical protein [Candidatus Hadarchaeum sp.]
SEIETTESSKIQLWREGVAEIQGISHLTLMIPISTKTIMASTTAPRRPNNHQPIKNAITEVIEM